MEDVVIVAAEVYCFILTGVSVISTPFISTRGG